MENTSFLAEKCLSGDWWANLKQQIGAIKLPLADLSILLLMSILLLLRRCVADIGSNAMWSQSKFCISDV